MKISEVKPGQIIVIEWANRTLTRPAKFMEVTVDECYFDHRDGGYDMWILRGDFKPLWGDGKYKTTRESIIRTSAWTVEEAS